MSLSSHINEKANLIWAIADKLTGVYKPHEYGEVILPLTVIRRFDCILSDTKDAVLTKYEQVKDLPMRDILLRNVSGYQFYNTSKYTFERLLDDPDNIETNFRDYLNGFSPNVQEIIEKFKFDGHITTMAQKNILYIVLKEFTTAQANLHPNHISNLEMGYIFEEIIRRFSEAHNEDAGQHYTPREVIELMVNILFYDDSDFLAGETVAKTIYDPACGTGGMLSVAENYLHQMNAGAELLAFGQEINDQTFAICKADMLIKGNDATQIKSGNTLSDDQFSGQTFDYILSNPPFGREWKNEKNAVEKEAKLGFAGRFGAGLPAVGDGQMLFLETAIAKMKPTGSRVAIIHNGSPLFTGDAGSGPSDIRKYILENDLLEAIIALPNDIFYNTGIATYIWVLSNKKADHRKGKVQLINANGLFEKRRKALGNKRNDISEEQIAEITRIYGDFIENDISKIFANEEFGYTKIVVERPLRIGYFTDEKHIVELLKENVLWDMVPKKSRSEISQGEAAYYAKRIYEYFHTINIENDTLEEKQFLSYEGLKEELMDYSKYLKETDIYQKGIPYVFFEAVFDLLEDTTPYGVPKEKGCGYEPDPNLRDTENVPLTEDVDAYFAREVLPFAPDAWIDTKKSQVGYEIPFTRYFYKYEAPRASEEIMREILAIEKELDGALTEVFA